MKEPSTKLLTIFMACLCLLSFGCSKLSTDYGKTSGSSAYSSINGYGTFRQAIKNAGFSDREISRLTDRLKRNTDLVVWAPQNEAPLNPEAVTWLDSLLKQPNRTLIYISPDSGSEVEYWKSTTAMAPAGQRMEYRRRVAKSQTERKRNRFNKTSQPPSYKWFTINELTQPETVTGIKGPWARTDTKNPDEDSGGTASTALPVKPLEYAIKTTGSPEKDNTRVLLETNRGTAYVAKITSKQWNNSQIFVVASGSLISNFGLTQGSNQLLADKLIQEVKSVKNSGLRAGYLNNDGKALIVSNANQGAPVASGMELMTVWPISLLTMHGIFLGFVICLMLLPIFGRPRKILQVTSGNFGHHLDAVAALMKRVGGEQYARTKISDYMKRVRGETAGPWIINESPSNMAKPIQTLRPSRLAATTGPGVSGEESQQTEAQQTEALSNATASSTQPMSEKDNGELEKS